jgi:hypothetical protein
MTHSSLLTNLWRPRDAKWMWPVMGVTSLVFHGLAVAVVRSLSIEVVQLNAAPASPLPIQLVTLPLDTAQASDNGANSAMATAERPDPQATVNDGSAGGDSGQVDSGQTGPPPPVSSSPFSASQPRPSLTPAAPPTDAPQPRGTLTPGSVAPPNSASNPRALPTLTPAPQPSPQSAPEATPPPTIRPQPEAWPNPSTAPTIRPQPQPTPSVDVPSPSPGFGAPSPVPPPGELGPGDQPPDLSTSPPLVTEPPVNRPPRPTIPPRSPGVETPSPIVPTPAPSLPGYGEQPRPSPATNPPLETPGEAPDLAREPGGTLTAYVRDHPSPNRRRDNPDVPPQVLSDNPISVNPLPAQCLREQFSTLQMVGTTMTVALDVLVETDGRIVPRGVLSGRGSGNPAVDNLVICLAREQLRLRPAYWEGAPIKTDAFIVEMQISF